MQGADARRAGCKLVLFFLSQPKHFQIETHQLPYNRSSRPMGRFTRPWIMTPAINMRYAVLVHSLAQAAAAKSTFAGLRLLHHCRKFDWLLKCSYALRRAPLTHLALLAGEQLADLGVLLLGRHAEHDLRARARGAG